MKLRNYLLIMASLIFLVIGQLFAKLGSNNILLENFHLTQFLNPWTILAYVCLFTQGIVWVLALKETKLSFAYPFMSLSFVLILIISYLILNETITLNKILGSSLIIGGIIVNSMNNKT